MIIYKIENKVNGKVYIGQSVGTLRRRWGQHVSAANKEYTNGCTKLYNAIRKYGRDGFTQEVLFESDDQSEIDTREVEFILKFNSIEHGYNLQLGGKLAKGHSQETKDKMSKTRKGKKAYEMTDEIRARISESKKGTPYHNNLSDSGRKSLSEKAASRLKGKRLPESAYSGEKTAKTYKICTPEGEEMLIKNLREFSREKDLNYDCMIQILRGKQKSHKGYKVESA